MRASRGRLVKSVIISKYVSNVGIDSVTYILLLDILRYGGRRRGGESFGGKGEECHCEDADFQIFEAEKRGEYGEEAGVIRYNKGKELLELEIAA
jgi:hypothetical protein